MALRAFHNNPGIGGFGESTPVLLDDTAMSNRKRNGRSYSSNSKDQVHTRRVSNHGIDVPDDKSSTNISSGDGDLLCQIIKELVDNAVDACRSNSPRGSGEAESCNENDDTGTQNPREHRPKKRIRVDIRPSKEHIHHRDGHLQVTVTDNGCGIENIQRCVNAFQSSKDGNSQANNISTGGEKNSNSTVNHTSGRYGIGLTLCLLHAQRCVPHSRACISSATPDSKYRTRAFFEVDQQGDSVDCVQEEVTRSCEGLEGRESGTCVSLLVPGGKAAKLAWPRLRDYFTRFRLCPKLHFELDVFAPTLSNLPIFIRPVTASQRPIEGVPSMETSQGKGKNNCAIEIDDPWEDLMDDDADDNGEEGGGDRCDENHPDERKQKSRDDSAEATTTSQKVDADRLAFFHTAKSFWPKRKISYQNIARSVRNIRNHNHIRVTSDGRKGIDKTSELQLEVYMAVCPHSQSDENLGSSADSSASTSCNDASCNDGDEEDVKHHTLPLQDQTASLELVRMVNGVPILDSTEAHSCGLVHGLANKVVWGSFGLDVDRNTTIVPDASASDPMVSPSHTPSFHLRDSNLIVPFIRRNLNHRQLKPRDQKSNHDDNSCEAEKKKKRKTELLSQNDLLPANVRIGTILVVVHIRAAPSSLPLPTLSKGRLPLNHQPIDSTLQLGLRDCLLSLRSTNPTLLLTTTQLRTVEREIRYIPGIASAVSRIVCRSNNKILRHKSLKLFQKQVCGDKEYNEQQSVKQHGSFESSTVEEQQQCGRDYLKVDGPSLANAFESRLRLAMKIKNETMNANKRRKKQKGSTIAKNNDAEEEYQDFDGDDENNSSIELSQSSVAGNKPGTIFLSSSPVGLENRILETDSEVSSQSVVSPPRHVTDVSEESDLPFSEIVIGDHCNLAMNRDEYEDDFDDWW